MERLNETVSEENALVDQEFVEPLKEGITERLLQASSVLKVYRFSPAAEITKPFKNLTVNATQQRVAARVVSWLRNEGFYATVDSSGEVVTVKLVGDDWLPIVNPATRYARNLS